MVNIRYHHCALRILFGVWESVLAVSAFCVYRCRALICLFSVRQSLDLGLFCDGGYFLVTFVKFYSKNVVGNHLHRKTGTINTENPQEGCRKYAYER